MTNSRLFNREGFSPYSPYTPRRTQPWHVSSGSLMLQVQAIPLGGIRVQRSLFTIFGDATRPCLHARGTPIYHIDSIVPDPSIDCTWAVCGRFARGTASPVSGSFSRPHSLATIVKCGLVKHSINGVRFRLLVMPGSTICVSKIDLVLGSSMNFKASRYLCGNHIQYVCHQLLMRLRLNPGEYTYHTIHSLIDTTMCHRHSTHNAPRATTSGPRYLGRKSATAQGV